MTIDPIVTDRLILRQWRDSDYAPFASLNADAEVMEHFPSVLTRGESDAMAQRCQDRIDQDGWGLWALESRDSGDFIGFTGLAAPRFEAHFTPTVEIGWRLRRSAWANGYASEAARAALRFGFEELKRGEIVSFTPSENLRSQAVMRRLGMAHDPADDFDHPDSAADSRLGRFVLYRLCAPS
ncbi:MAG: GNAT family N-acetyltransferase [Antricoccus sp.]